MTSFLGGSPGGAGAGQSKSTARKRVREGSQILDSDDGAEAIPAKRRAPRVTDELLSCPFRKRNRARFNVRDHVHCTRGFPSLTLVKSIHPTPLQVRVRLAY